MEGVVRKESVGKETPFNFFGCRLVGGLVFNG